MQQQNRDRFIEDNLGLVHSCAGRFKGRGIEYEDLYAAGCMGLVKAYDAFDWQRGVCFSTYAVPVILGEIKKLFRDGGTVKVSRGLKELGLKVNAAQERMVKQTGISPTISQIAAELGVDEEQVSQAIHAGLPALSLTPVTDDEDHQLDVPVESPEDQLADCISLQTELMGLTEEDYQLIRLRFYKELTQSETAKILGTTQVQVSRRERKILASLRQRMLV